MRDVASTSLEVAGVRQGRSTAAAAAGVRDAIRELSVGNVTGVDRKCKIGSRCELLLETEHLRKKDRLLCSLPQSRIRDHSLPLGC